MANFWKLAVATATILLIVPSNGQDTQKFAVGLYKTIAQSRQPGENIALSPFSADAALSMTLVGAGGVTKSELATTLGVAADATSASLGRKFKAVTTSSSNSYTVKSANAIFVQKSYPILPKYRSHVVDDFQANISSVDFSGNVEGARLQINAFAAEKTNNKIRDLLPEGSLSSAAKVVLVNAVYFKADWQKKFKEYQTSPAPFNSANGQQKTSSFMYSASSYGYAVSSELGGAQLVELKYVEGETSMVVILPKKEGGLQGLESSLTSTALETALGRLSPDLVEVYLPKFKVNTDYELVGPLSKLGVKAAFSSSADFPGISGGPLTISKVVQKVFVDVNEEGTEAAAATAIVAVPTSGSFFTRPPAVFRADRPFIYLIRHNQSKAILFIGRVSDPTVEK